MFPVCMKSFNDTTIRSLTSWLEHKDDFVFLESSRLSEENHQSFLFRNPSTYLSCYPGDSATDFLNQVDHIRSHGKYLAGCFAYEFGYLLEPRLRKFLSQSQVSSDRPLALLGVYDTPLIFDHKTGLFRNGTGWPQEVLRGSGQENRKEKEVLYSCQDVQTSMSRQQYIQAIEAIQQYIQAGDTYQVNFTLHFEFSFQGSIAALYRALRRNQSVAYTAWIRHQGQDILSFSPELFFHAESNKIRVRPMKGTMSRGRTTAEDATKQKLLCTDPKNQSENVMIVDLLRNDISRLLYADEQQKTQGRVETRSLFDVEIYESLLQMTSTIDGIVNKPPLSFQRLIQALFPCGSVTGAPKIRTMEIIHELEQQPRGIYCGAIGYTGPDQTCFNVPIRTLEFRQGQGRMGIGSGIVADSVAEDEWEECLLKGNFLTKSRAEFQLIETLLWQPETGYFLLDYHLERLQDSARYFHFYSDPVEIQHVLEKTAIALRKKKENIQQWRVRLLLYRDGGLEISTTPLKESTQQRKAQVLFSPEPVDNRDPHRFHKTTQRKLYIREFQRATKQGYYDILFTNTAGEVTEGAITNIFIRRKKGEPLLTPPVLCGLLPGTYRRMLLEQGKSIEQVLSKKALLAAEELYVANAVRGLVPVCLIQDQKK